jgi:hypothetical protein
MATQTRTIGVLVDDTDGTLATLAYTYDDVSLLVTSIIITNGTNHSVFASATGTANGRTYSRTTAPHTTDTVPVGSNQAQRLQLVTTPSGKLDGVAVVWGWAP